METRIASDEEEAVTAATAIGFPVVVKLHSETISHKSDVGGVKLTFPIQMPCARPTAPLNPPLPSERVARAFKV